MIFNRFFLNNLYDFTSKIDKGKARDLDVTSLLLRQRRQGLIMLFDRMMLESKQSKPLS